MSKDRARIVSRSTDEALRRVCECGTQRPTLAEGITPSMRLILVIGSGAIGWAIGSIIHHTMLS